MPKYFLAGGTSDDAYDRAYHAYRAEQDEPDPPADADEMQVTWTDTEISAAAIYFGEA